MPKSSTRNLGIPLSALAAASLSVAVWAIPDIPSPAELAKPRAEAFKTSLPLQRALPRQNNGFVSKLPVSVAGNAQQVFAVASDAAPELIGSVVFANNWTTDNAPVGLYSVPSTPGGAFTAIPIKNAYGEAATINANGGGVLVGDHFFYTGYYEFWGMELYFNAEVDLSTGVELYSANATRDNIAVDMAYDPTTENIYGIFTNPDPENPNYVFGTIVMDETGAVTTPIAEVDGNWNALAVSRDGTVYAIKNELQATELEDGQIAYTPVGSKLVKFDKIKGTYTVIGDTGQKPLYSTSATFDFATDRMYWAVSPVQGAYLCELNLETGAATVVSNFPEEQQVLALSCKLPAAKEAAPGSVSDLILSFPEGGMNGTVSFTLPTKAVDGSSLSGDVNYTITGVDGKLAEGAGAPGEAISANVTVTSTGRQNIVVTTSNAAGEGLRAHASSFVGKGIPSAPQVSLTYADGKATLTWDKVGTSTDGGYVDPEATVYNVTLDGLTVAENLAATSYTHPLAQEGEMGVHHFQVVAVYADKQSAPAIARPLILGGMEPPYNQRFKKRPDLKAYTIVNANSDENEWQWSEFYEAMALPTNSTVGSDDWLILPPMKFEGGKLYVLDLTAFGTADYMTERIEVKMGNLNEVSALTQSIVPMTVVACDDSNPATVSATILPETDGYYYIGIHGLSDNLGACLYLSRIQLSGARTTDVPAEPTAMKITRAADGSDGATISFTAPTKSVAGGNLTELSKVELLRNGSLIHTFESVQPGQALSYDDTVDACAIYTYSAKAYNAAGEGVAASVSALVGMTTPQSPMNVDMVETETPGTVKVTWDPVEFDVNDNRLNPADVTYQICLQEGFFFNPKYDTQDTEYTFAYPLAAGQQAFAAVAVQAKTAKGTSMYTQAPLIAVGPAYKGMHESFANGGMTYQFRAEGMIMPANCTDETIPGIVAQDGDNGYVALSGYYAGDNSIITTGKIDLSGIDKPTFGFWEYVLTQAGGVPTKDGNQVQVIAICDGVETSLYDGLIGDISDEEGWAQVIIDLSAYAGKTIQLQMIHTNNVYTSSYVDNLNVGSLAAVAAVGEINDGAVSIRGGNGEIIVEGETAVRVITADGKILYSGNASRIPAAPGIYAVQTGSKTTTVLVK